MEVSDEDSTSEAGNSTVTETSFTGTGTATTFAGIAAELDVPADEIESAASTIENIRRLRLRARGEVEERPTVDKDVAEGGQEKPSNNEAREE